MPEVGVEGSTEDRDGLWQFTGLVPTPDDLLGFLRARTTEQLLADFLQAPNNWRPWPDIATRKGVFVGIAFESSVLEPTVPESDDEVIYTNLRQLRIG